MNFQDFKLKRPEFVREAKKCKNQFEFTKVAEKHGIRFGADSFDKAYELLCDNGTSHLSDDMLASAAGGAKLQPEVQMTELGNTTILKLD